MNKILLVDDSPFFLKLITSLLDRSGCNVLTATNAEDAFKLINEERPRLVLLDQYMPDLTGDKICKKIKDTDEIKDTIVIMLSVSNNKSDMDKCFAAGCDEYITKPIDKERLLDCIGKYAPIVKRKYKRVPIYESVKYYHNDVGYSGHIHVISKGGAFIMGEHKMPPDSLITLKFSISKIHESLEVTGKVVWNLDSKETYPQLLATAQGMGIQFIEISDEAKNVITRYMALGNFLI